MYFLFVRNLLSKQVLGLKKKPLIYRQLIKVHNVRSLCSQPVAKNDSLHSEEPNCKLEWNPIYHFPLIQLARLINRVKLYQSVFTFTLVPISIVMYNYNLTELMTLKVVSGSAVFTCITLYIISSFFKRLIGVIFVSNDEKYVKIAHLTFWGNRKEIVVAVDNIVPLTEGTCNANDAFVKLYRNNTNEVLYITLKFGAFLDRKSFQNIFGSFEILGFKN